MGKKRVNASLGFFLSSFLLYVRRLGTNQSEDTDSWLVRFFVGWKEDRVNKESAG